MRDAQDISAQSLPNITYTPRPNASPEAEISALAAIYRFLVLEKGDRNDLIGTSTKECATSQDKKGKENADIHGD
jgi:hypothetical protein